MKKLSILFCTFLCSYVLPAQLNMDLRSEVKYNEELSDIWGYEADGREYALVGLFTGVNIVDVTDPDNPVDLGTARGASSIWRDIKTWDKFAYITNETGGGVMVIDLSNLPTPITEDDYYNWAPNLNSQGTLGSCHNIFVDEFGYGYITGCNLNNGGPIFLDLFTTPGTPIHVGNGAAVYGHDVYARNNIMYSSEINAGHLSLYDVSDKENPVFLNSQTTPSNFTHNAWLSDDGKTVFTTDERANAPVAAYDISNPLDIKELDQYRPITTLGEGVIPHNVHVWENWLIISYYTDGCIIVDGSRPSNLIEVGNFDTFIPNSTGFDGVWGIYPFLPSRTVIASDIGNGLFVLTPHYVRACWLEGKVTNSETGAALNGVDISIIAAQDNLSTTDFQGAYQTGLATAGTYNVTYSKFGFYPQTLSVDLENGVLKEVNVQLEPINTSASGKITNAKTGAAIPFAQVSITDDIGTIEATANANGEFSLQSFLPGNYTIYAGAWGFHAKELEMEVNDGGSINIALQPGIYDEFILDLGWEVNTTAVRGGWERGEPKGTFNNNTPSNPDNDLEDDLGDQCYVTGNAGGGVGDDDIDGGSTRLISPVIDVRDMQQPILHFYYWFYNASGNGTPNDYFNVILKKGSEEITLAEYTVSTGGWTESINFDLTDQIKNTDEIQIIFESADIGAGHLVEAAVDGFSLVDALATSVETPNVIEAWQLTAKPSVFEGTTQIQYELPGATTTAQLIVHNTLGQIVESFRLESSTGLLTIGSQLTEGIYLVQIESADQKSQILQIVKTQ